MVPFGPQSQLQSLLDVEVALATAEAEVGVIPSSCVSDIRNAARAELFDVAALEAESALAGNVVIPLVRQLRERVSSQSAASAQYVHHGATSQDIIDTALVLQLRASTPMLLDQLARAMSSAAATVRAHTMTPMPGRTWLQQASPITFGLKAAGWLDLIGRVRERLGDALGRVLIVQFGGASGTLASLGTAGPQVLEAFAHRLSLSVPDMPWHTHRDRVADVAATLGLTCGALGKIGRDLVLLGQSEVGEVRETAAPGMGTSSAMPHKQNPVHAVTAVAASIRAPGLVAVMLAAMPQEHERAAGGWQAEWTTMPELVRLTLQSAEAIADALSRLDVDPARMRDNLQRGGGMAMSEALAAVVSQYLPRQDAAALVERLSRAAERDRRSLRDVATEDVEIRRWLSAADIEAVLTPDNYLGSAAVFVERVLQRWSL